MIKDNSIGRFEVKLPLERRRQSARGSLPVCSPQASRKKQEKVKKRAVGAEMRVTWQGYEPGGHPSRMPGTGGSKGKFAGRSGCPGGAVDDHSIAEALLWPGAPMGRENKELAQKQCLSSRRPCRYSGRAREEPRQAYPVVAAA